MKILLAGGSGFIGGNLCEELLSRGHEVTVLARSPGDADLPDGAATAMGDVTAYDSLVEPFEGHDAVVNLVSLSPLYRPSGGEEMHDRIHRRGTENVVRAAEERGVGRLLQMSGIGADPDGPTHFLRAKGRAEEIVRDSDLEWTIVRPGVVLGEDGEFVWFTKLVSPPYVTPLPGGGRTPFQPIWIGDLVPMLATALEEEKHVGETYELGGPETLTLAEVARLAHGTDGRPVNVVPIPMALVKVGFGALGAIPGAPMGPDQYRSLTLNHTVSHNDVDAFGVEESDLRTLGEYLRGE